LAARPHRRRGARAHFPAERHALLDRPLDPGAGQARDPLVQEQIEALAAVALADAEDRLRLAHPTRHRSPPRTERVASGLPRDSRDAAATHAQSRPESIRTSPLASRTRKAWNRKRRSG